MTANLTVTAQYEQQATGLTLTVETKTAQRGQEVRILVSVRNNPGILGAALKLSFDDSVLTLVSAENGAAASALTMTPPGKFHNGCRFVWDAMELEDGDIQDGEFLVLTFRVAENAPAGHYAVELSGRNGDIFDKDWNDLTPAFSQGGITVS